MGFKAGMVVGLSVGFVLGARAGRERYEYLKTLALRLRGVPIIAAPLDSVGERAAESVRLRGEAITDAVAEAVKEKLFGVGAGAGTRTGAEADA